MGVPWESEPAVWGKFCKLVRRDPQSIITQTVFRTQKIMRDRYHWFSQGVAAGGCA